MRIIFLGLIGMLLAACQPAASPESTEVELPNVQKKGIESSGRTAPISSEFNAYWYQGKAEVSSYKLVQARYGQEREGHVVMIFVTEDFSKNKQVKLDYPGEAGIDKLPVLKLNYLKKFTTGIYDYAVMQSIFTPVDYEAYPHSIKTTNSSQDWCGHSFAQTNLSAKSIDYQRHSYFESRGEVDMKMPLEWMEDELWTRIRIAPHTLPTGNIKLIPSGAYMMLNHKEAKPYAAKIKLSISGNENIYTVEYPELKRTLNIHFEAKFPHKIFTIEDSYPSGFNGKVLTTKATLIKTMQTAYWSQNGNVDLPLRTELGLP